MLNNSEINKNKNNCGIWIYELRNVAAWTHYSKDEEYISSFAAGLIFNRFHFLFRL